MLEGFPHTEFQVHLLSALKLKPTLVFMLNQSEQQSIAKISGRRIDPYTGEIYNINLINFKDKDFANVVVESISDKAKLKKFGLDKFEMPVIKSLIESSPDKKLIDVQALKRLVRPADDNAELVKKRYQVWKQTSAMLEDHLTENLMMVDVEGKSVGDVHHILASTVLDKFV